MGLLSPKILEYNDGHIEVSLNAALIPEIKAILDQFPGTAEPYLVYLHLMTALDSPYANLPREEKEDTIIFDVHRDFTGFDPAEPLLAPAVEKLEGLMETRMMRYYKNLGISIDKMGEYLKDKEITEGRDGNLSEIIRILKESGSTMRTYKDIEKQVEEELKIEMRGNAEMGEY